MRPVHGWSVCFRGCCHDLCRYERVADGEARVIVVVNAARKSWQGGEYGVWVGSGGSFKQMYCSQVGVDRQRLPMFIQLRTLCCLPMILPLGVLNSWALMPCSVLFCWSVQCWAGMLALQLSFASG